MAQVKQVVPLRKRLRPSVGQVDHEVESTLKHVIGANGNSVADLRNTIVDSEANKKTLARSTIEHSKITGDAISVAQGATVVSGDTPNLFQQLAARMNTLLDNAFFDDSDDSVESIEQTLSDFKNNPMDLSADHYQQISGNLDDVDRALSRHKHKKTITKMTALTTVLGKIQTQHASTTLTVSAHHVDAHNGQASLRKVENTATARASNNVVGGNLIQAVAVNGDVHLAMPKAHPVPSQSLFSAETFVGRRDDLELIKTQILGSKSISIVAHGGMGKSSLVAEALKEIPEQELSTLYPGGIIVCQFYDRPNIVVQVEHIIKSLNPEGKIDRHPIAHMQRELGVKRCLVILDGLEAIEYQDQQKEKTYSFRQFIEAMGSSGLVITTRDGKQVQGQELQLRPLVEGPVLLEYLIERQDPNSSKELCDALGNVPLAIRLAGHYIKTVNDTVTSYLKWIQTEEAGLAGLAEEMDVEEKYRSIKKMMERSVDRLSAPAKSGLGVIGRLALQGFKAELLEVALAIDGRAVNRVIMNLKQYGLIRDTGIGTGRHQLEHALIQSYARKYVPVDEMGLSRVGQYYDDLSQAHRNAAGYKVLDLEKNHMVSIAGHLMRQASSRSLGFRLVVSMESYLDRQGHFEDRRVLLEIKEQEARESGDKVAEAASLCSLGIVYAIRGDLSQAEEMYKKTLEIYQALGSKAGMAIIYGNLGVVYYTRGELSQAGEMYQKALELNEALGSKKGMARDYCNLGNVYNTRGELSQAEEMYQKALELNQALGRKEGMARNYCCLGNVYKTRRELSQAEEMYQKALELNQALGSKKGVANQYGNLGNVYYTRGELSQAEEMFHKALELNQAIGSKQGIANQYCNLGNVYYTRGELSQAEEMYQKALELNQALGSKKGMAFNYGNLGNVYKTHGELSHKFTFMSLQVSFFHQAEEMYQKALELNQALGSKEGMAIYSFNLGLLYKAQHRYPAAKALFEQSRQYHSGFLPPDHDRFQMIENQLLEIQSTLKDAPLGQKTAGAANTGTVDVEETDTVHEQVDD